MPNPYHDHLQRSLRYIEKNLLGGLSLEDCAKAAGYSAYHFHRVFRMVLGVTPGVYIRLRRLAIAADLMAKSGMNLDSVAEASGFSCKEVLIRAFQREHGISPSSYREAQNCLRLQPDMAQWLEGEASDSDVPLVPRIAPMPALTIVGYAVTVTREEARGYTPTLEPVQRTNTSRHNSEPTTEYARIRHRVVYMSQPWRPHLHCRPAGSTSARRSRRTDGLQHPRTAVRRVRHTASHTEHICGNSAQNVGQNRERMDTFIALAPGPRF